MNPPPRKQNQYSDEIQEFLDNGGKIQQFEYGQRSEEIEFQYSFYGKRKKAATTNEDAPKED